MRDLDFRSLPKLRDSFSFIFVEHAKIDKTEHSVSAFDKEGQTEIPVASLTLLMLGPGTSITHEAVKTLADNGCLIVWCGEQGIRYYAHGVGETKKGGKAERQARLWADKEAHMRVVRAMYALRLKTTIKPEYSLQQLRGMEGVRVREAYAKASRLTGIPWTKRDYDHKNWCASDDVNKAISAANACLYGLCHSAIVTAGYIPALGFIHTGRQLSFVYDIADLYKVDVTIPAAFEAVKSKQGNIETFVRRVCRDRFQQTKLLARIIPDLEYLMLCGEGKIDPNKKFTSEDLEEEESEVNPYANQEYWEPNPSETPHKYSDDF